MTENEWLGQPMGEIPASLPSIARAYRAVDAVADQLRSLKAEHTQLQAENTVLRAADAEAQAANIYPALVAANHGNTILARELEQAAAELEQLRDERDELLTRVDELEEDYAYALEALKSAAHTAARAS